jgi:hypothetical protein
MNQADRDRLVVLKKAKKRLITQKEAPRSWGSRNGRSGGYCTR